jgi:predicted alpha/beta-hydrolase family hydrolase
MEYLQIETSTPINAHLNRRSGRELAVLLPGLNYTAENPLFYYIDQLLHERGVDALSIEFAYSRDDTFLNAPDDDRLERLRTDGRAIIEFARKLGEYDLITIIGKSLGTISMGWAINDLPEARLVWLTPSLGGTGLRTQMLGRPNPAFCLIGTRDPAYSDALVEELTADGIAVAIIEGADHGISHADGTVASVELVQQSIEKLAIWMDAAD